jgi:hypothetical protein
MVFPTRAIKGWQDASEHYPGQWVLYGPDDQPDIWVFQHDGVWMVQAIYPSTGDFTEPTAATTLEEAQAVAVLLVKMR